MPPTTKNSHQRETDDEREALDAPRVDEVEPEDRSQSKLGDSDDGNDEDEDEDETDEEDDVEEIDIDDLSAMEGPDA